MRIVSVVMALLCIFAQQQRPVVWAAADESAAAVTIDVDGGASVAAAGGGAEEAVTTPPPVKKAPPTKRNTKAWNKVDFNAVEKDWENGDDAELLEHEFEITRKIAEKKRQELSAQGIGFSLNPIKDPETGEERLDPEQMQRLMGMAKNDPMGLSMGGTSGVMVFVELNKERKKGEGWTKREVDKLAGRWVGLLRSASLDGKVYNTQQDDPNPKVPTLLISVDKAWMAQDVMKFIVQQKETAKVTYNSKEYTKADFPKDYFPEDDDDD